MGAKVKVVKVSAASTQGWFLRSFFTPSMDKVIEKWVRKGWALKSTTPVSGWRGTTTHYLLHFEQEGKPKR